MIVPSGIIAIISIHLLTDTTYRITWEGINCSEQNGEIIGYRITVEGNNSHYTTDTSVSQSVDVALLNRDVYNISIAVINIIGIGPFSDSKKINLYNGKN